MCTTDLFCLDPQQKNETYFSYVNLPIWWFNFCRWGKRRAMVYPRYIGQRTQGWRGIYWSYKRGSPGMVT